MRVLFIAPSPFGGTLQVTHNLANALAERGNEVTLATGLGFELKNYRRNYHAVEVFDRFTPHPILIARFFRHLRLYRPQIIHLQGNQHPDLYLLLVAVLRRITDAHFVYTPYDVLPSRTRRHHIWAIRRLCAKMQHIFISAHENQLRMRDHFNINLNRITVLPVPDCGTFLREDVTPRLPAVSPDQRVILCLGLIQPRKGICTLINAMETVVAKVPDAYLVIAGKPYMDLEPFYKSIQQLGLEKHVEIVPRYVDFDAMAGYFVRADVVALAYHSGWNSALLSMAIGFEKPVVATTGGPFQEVITHNESGLLVSPGNPAELAEALVNILTDDTLRYRLQKGANKVAARNSWKKVAATTERIYFKTLQQNGA